MSEQQKPPEIPPLQWTPESIALHMRHTVDRLEKSAKVVKDAQEVFFEAKRAWTVAKAVSRQEATGSVTDRDDKATIATMELYKTMDTASVAHAYARDLANVLEKKLSALQTQAKLILVEYNTGGRM
jgi:hypothetical protein